jgi:hypothetical protein
LGYCQLLSPDTLRSLQRLAKEKWVDLSMEALVLKEPWRELFTAQELSEAANRVQVDKKMAEL